MQLLFWSTVVAKSDIIWLLLLTKSSLNQKLRFYHKPTLITSQPHPRKIDSPPSTKHYHCPCLDLFYSLMKVKSMCLFYWFPLCRMRDWCRYISAWIGIWCSSLYLCLCSQFSFLHSFHFQLQLNASCSSCINCNIQFENWKSNLCHSTFSVLGDYLWFLGDMA